MSYINYWSCPDCSKHSFFHQSTIKHDGTIGACTGCGKQALRHVCHNRTTQQSEVWWLPLLLTGISVACPTCKMAYQISNAVESAPESPAWLKSIAAGVGVLAITVGILKLVDNLQRS